VQAWDRDETRLLANGTLSSVDNRIDTQTGTVRLRAQFDNSRAVLFPNQSVNVRLGLGKEPAIVIPEAAVQFGSKGSYVYVIGEDSKASVRPVKLGASNSGRVAVAEGLEPGEQVVLEGLDRLYEGAEVEIVGTDADGRAREAKAADGAA